MKILFSPPDIIQDDIDAVVEVLKSGWITTGPKTKEFEEEITKYCKAKGSIALNSATAGLELTLRLLGIGEGDEVITSAYTYTASASIINHVGAKIVLCDTKKDSYFMDLNDLSSKINEKTKAIIPVDIGGILADYKGIEEIIEDKKEIFISKSKLQEKMGKIAIIADAAHSFGASLDKVKSGNIADFSSFSFHAVKNLTTAEGGAITWKKDYGYDIYNELKLLSIHGQSKHAFEKNKLGSWEYDILIPGYKCNLTDIASALGLSQLKRYNKMLEVRKSIVKKYDDFFDSKGINHINHFMRGESSYHLYLIRYGKNEEERNKFIEKLALKGVPLNVHYKPLPLLTAYRNLGFSIEDFKNSYNQYKNTITLPLYSKLKEEEIEYIFKNIKESL